MGRGQAWFFLTAVSTPSKQTWYFRWIKPSCLTLQAGFLRSLEWQRFPSHFARGGKHKRLRCIINHAACLLQRCQESDHPRTAHQYSRHLSAKAGHAYPSAFGEVSMRKHPSTIFRVVLAIFITSLSVPPICHVVRSHQCLSLAISPLRGGVQSIRGSEIVRGMQDSRSQLQVRVPIKKMLWLLTFEKKYRHYRSLCLTQMSTFVCFLVSGLYF